MTKSEDGKILVNSILIRTDNKRYLDWEPTITKDHPCPDELEVIIFDEPYELPEDIETARDEQGNSLYTWDAETKELVKGS